MPVRPVRFGVLLPVLTLAACASSTGVKAPEGVAPAVTSTFEKRPPRPPGCAFDLFEDREPPRPYVVLGALPVQTNEWLGGKRRKALLRKTVCEAGADAVLLQRPEERAMAHVRVREYTALFLAYTDVPARVDPDAPPPPLPPPSGGDYAVPISEDLMGDTHGTEVRTQEAAESDGE